MTESDCKPTAIVLLSGGLDSCVAAAVAARDHSLYLLHADYGQRTQTRERQAATDIAEYYGTTLHRMDISHIILPGSSNLTVTDQDPEPGNLEREDLPATYVPFRNANLLSAAVSRAEAIGAVSVFIGVVEEDGSGYPDCRKAFLQDFQKAVDSGTAVEQRITVAAPLVHLNKTEIVKLGQELNAPLQLTWSCYYGNRLACGRCDSCLLRLRGFAGAGVSDPLPYEE